MIIDIPFHFQRLANWNTAYTEEQEIALSVVAFLNLFMLSFNLVGMVYIWARYILKLKIKNNMVWLFYGIAFSMTVSYGMF